MRFTRRAFNILGASALAGSIGLSAEAALAAGRDNAWWHRTKRWSQINLTEDNAINFDLPFWRDYWRSSQTQGVILNAGGGVAFYPTTVPGHPKASLLGDRDLFGDLRDAARADGLEVIARLAFRGSPELLAQHPDWAMMDAAGNRLPVACMNGGYYYDFGAAVTREVAQRYRPSGFTASGWGQNYSLCHCANCRTGFRRSLNRDLPPEKNWSDPLYRAWIEWNESRVIALWDNYNGVASEAAGLDCLFVGQLVGSMPTRGLKAISARSPFIMLDHQLRNEEAGFQENTETGKLFNGLVDWKKPIAEAQAIYGSRLTSVPPNEARMWMAEGMAGGLVPWWHTVSAYTQDKRRYDFVGPMMQWHARNEQYLFQRRPIASVGIVWSDTNNIFFARDNVDRTYFPWLGLNDALVRGRIPYVVVHADYIDRDAGNLSTLVLPNLGAMTDEQAASVRRFVKRGGNLVATGETSLYDRYGDRRADYALSDLFGAHFLEPPPAPPQARKAPSLEQITGMMRAQLEMTGTYVSPDVLRGATVPQSHLRLTPELRRASPGPHEPGEPQIEPGAVRHPVLHGLDRTDIVQFGGTLQPIRLDPGAQALLTYIPPVPAMPPESGYIRDDHTNVPALIVNTMNNGSRIVFVPAGLDRRFHETNNPDFGDILQNSVRWAAKDTIPLEVESTGLLDCNLYAQPGRVIVHVANLNAVPGRLPAEDFIPVGPVRLRVRLPRGVTGGTANLLVAARSVSATMQNGWAEIEIPNIALHEVVVIS